MAKCSKCSRDAITYIRYNGQYLCRYHFIEFVERRFKRELRRQLRIRGHIRIAVGVSGGKDSMTLLRLLLDVLGERRDVEIFAVLIDEGIAGYRDRARIIAEKAFTEWGVEYYVGELHKIVGYTVDYAASVDEELNPCTYCGVFRRHAINRMAREHGADVIAMGHNLDDVAQTFLMNIMSGDVRRTVRTGPHIFVQEGLIPRIYPLMRIPENEIFLYAMLRGIPFYHGECPYASEGDRAFYRDVIYRREQMRPGTRHAMVNYYEKVKECLIKCYPPEKLVPCEICGEPTSSGERICQKCKLVERLRSIERSRVP